MPSFEDPLADPHLFHAQEKQARVLAVALNPRSSSLQLNQLGRFVAVAQISKAGAEAPQATALSHE